MRATDILRHEQERILVGLSQLKQHVAAAAAGLPDWVPLQEVLTFLREFAARDHHGKERSLIRLLMKAQGAPSHPGPLGDMLNELAEGRILIDRMLAQVELVQRVDAVDMRELERASQGYIALMRQHIFKENEILFPIANRVLSDAVQRQLAAQFKPPSKGQAA